MSKQIVVGLASALTALLVACSTGSGTKEDTEDPLGTSNGPSATALPVTEDAGSREADAGPDATSDADVDAGPQPGDSCTSGVRSCNGTTPLKCESGKWVTDGTCTGSNPVCDQGLCVACTTGNKQCVSSTPRTCVAGQWQYDNACSGTNGVCLDGTCVQCVPNDKRCTGSTPEVCSINGTWQAQPTCSGATPTCEPTTARCIECNPGDKKCDGMDSMTCNAQKEWEKVESCLYACGGAGVCGVCLPNNFRCNAPPNSTGLAQTCNESGQWYTHSGAYCTLTCSGDPRYIVDDTAKTVRDMTTNLTWERNIVYANPGTSNYANASVYCAAKGGGWRLPTLYEVQALRPSNTNCNHLDEAAFPGIVGHYVGVWTSTSNDGIPGQHAIGLGLSYEDDSTLHNVMCVK